MKEIIEQKLNEIEEKENVKILHCVESGSRAWGFASLDSDYDVRFFYIRPKEFYLRLNAASDVIEWQLDEILDINGWDVQKALRLLHKSNPTLFEWNSSPIVYKTTKEWQKVSQITDGYFLKKHGLYHYLNMAKGNFRDFLKTDNVRLKKYFYVLRPLLACKWILAKGTPPPMEFSRLMSECLEPSLTPVVTRLLDLKINSPEIKEIPRIEALNEYLESNIEEIISLIEDLPGDKPASWEELNSVFLSLFNLEFI